MAEPRSKQSVPAEIRDDLLSAIRNSFYAEAPKDAWHRNKRFILLNVVLWPASWLNKRGVTLPPIRYKSVVLDVLNGIKRHGQTEAVKYWPGYLMVCVQSHFRIHGEEYYNEGKALRTSVASIVERTSTLPTVDPVRALAEVRKDLLQSSRKTSAKRNPTAQMRLF